MFWNTHYYFVLSVSEEQKKRDEERDGESHRERAGRNKDEGIGVGGWTIRCDHPMKPSAHTYTRSRAYIYTPVPARIADTILYRTFSTRRSFIGIKVISGRERVKRSVYVPLVAA